jgi:Domain of unknown function (DUF4349)
MNTDIDFLKSLESDLEDVASRERIRLQRVALKGSIRRNTGRTWMKVAGVAAAFLVVAGSIGFVASGGSVMPLAGRDKFQEVGDAVASEGGLGGEEAPVPGPRAAPSTDDDERALAGLGGGDEEALGGGQGGGQQQDLSKIVRDGRIGIVVRDDGFGGAVDQLTLIAERSRGFVLSSTTNNDRSGTFVLRIPEQRFDRARAAIRDLGTRVRFEEVRGDDVTAEYIDYQARLRILKTRKALLSGLLLEADTTDEILRLSGQVEDVQLRIEQLQGQLRFLNDQVAESTLRVSIQEQSAPAVAARPAVDNPDLGSSFELAVQGFLRIVGAVIVGLGYLIPITAIAVIVWMAVWFVRRRRATA